MTRFYRRTAEGKWESAGKAWSVMSCRRDECETTHVWNSDYAVYGPYLCPGTKGDVIATEPEMKAYEKVTKAIVKQEES